MSLPGAGLAAPPWTAYSPCGPECLPAAASTPRASLLTRLLRYAGLLALLLGGLALVPVMPFAGRTGRALLTRWWCRTLLATVGVRLSVTVTAAAEAGLGVGGVLPEGSMVVANHVSWLDIPALAAIAPYRILAKRDVASWPVIGTFATIAGTLYIDRARLRTLPRTVAELRDVLRAGRSVLVFPSGTTFCGRKPERFRPATFQSAIDAAATVRPVAIRYRLAGDRPGTVAAYLGDDTLIASLHRVVSTRGLSVEVRLLPPITTVGADRRTLARRAQAAVAGIPPAQDAETVAAHAPAAGRAGFATVSSRSRRYGRT